MHAPYMSVTTQTLTRFMQLNAGKLKLKSLTDTFHLTHFQFPSLVQASCAASTNMTAMNEIFTPATKCKLNTQE
jgi:hypothetical protein